MYDLADTRALAGIPHLLNTLSPLPLVIAGGAGLGHTIAEGAGSGTYARRTSERIGLMLTFVTLVGAGFGMSYFHVHPSADRAPWVVGPLGASLVLCLVVGATWRPYDRRGDLAAAGVWLVIAGALAVLDHWIYSLGGLISGHTLAHLALGAAAGWLARGVARRRERPTNAPADSPPQG